MPTIVASNPFHNLIQPPPLPLAATNGFIVSMWQTPCHRQEELLVAKARH